MWNKKDGRVMPVIIVNTRGSVIGTGIINEKGYRKSIEQNEAWLLDGESGRLLPDPKIRGFISILRRAAHVEIQAEDFTVSVPPSELLKDLELPADSNSLAQLVSNVDHSTSSIAFSDQDSHRSGAGRTMNHTTDLIDQMTLQSDSVLLSDAGVLLARLEDLIYERKKSLPAGSYTTHLFEQGEEKIRKKTGEEAVELILARDNEEIASETADLLYHVMVFFADRGMSLGSALRILWERR